MTPQPHQWKPGDNITAERLDSTRKALPKLMPGPGIDMQQQGPAITIGAPPARRLPRVDFWIRITSATPVSGQPNRWVYGWDHVHKAAPGYGGWSIPDTGARTSSGFGQAYNLAEVMNDGAGLEGHGVNVDGAGFPDGFSTMPCPIDQIVMATSIRVASTGARETWFYHANAVDGVCDE